MTANAFGDVNKRAVTEDGTVQVHRNCLCAATLPRCFRTRSDTAAHFRYRAEQHTRFRQFFSESSRYGDRIKHNINRHTGKRLLLVERDAQFFIGRQQLRIDFIETLGRSSILFGWE